MKAEVMMINSAEGQSSRFSARRMDLLGPQFFAALNRRVAALQAAGIDVIRLDIGSPDLPPHPAILKVLSDSAARQDHHGYQPHLGPPALRAAWAEMYRRLYAVELDPHREVVPLLGSKEGIFHLMQALIDPGDVVLVPDPGYLTYGSATRFAGGEVHPLPLLLERSYLPDFASIPPAIARRAKVMWLNYPNNPTAATVSLDFFCEAVEFARRYEILLCHDAAYSQVSFDGYSAPSLLQVPGAVEMAVEFNSLSKSHNMAGWRLGVACGNRQALQALYCLKTHADSGHFLPVLDAACQAMTGDQAWLLERNQVYASRRDLLLEALHAIGLRAQAPRASLYIWCPVPDGWSSEDFAATMLEVAHVSLTPGTVFGRYGEGFVRIAFTEPQERILTAIARIQAALPGLNPAGAALPAVPFISD